MVRTRGECREQKVTLAQSHRVAVAGKVLHILYLKGARRPQPLSAEHVRVREYARARALSPSRTREVLALLSSRDRSHLNLPAMRVVRARFSMCSALMIPSYQKEERNRIERARGKRRRERVKRKRRRERVKRKRRSNERARLWKYTGRWSISFVSGCSTAVIRNAAVTRTLTRHGGARGLPRRSSWFLFSTRRASKSFASTTRGDTTPW